MTESNNGSNQTLTVDMLASDIRQLAYEVNNLAITVSALVELLSVDKEKLKNTAQAIFEAAVANSANQEDEKQDPLSKENINASGPTSHPENAAIFGG